MLLLDCHILFKRREFVNIDEWAKVRKMEIDLFVKNWKAHNLIDPDNWPLELDPVEWNEQEWVSLYDSEDEE